MKFDEVLLPTVENQLRLFLGAHMLVGAPGNLGVEQSYDQRKETAESGNALSTFWACCGQPKGGSSVPAKNFSIGLDSVANPQP